MDERESWDRAKDAQGARKRPKRCKCFGCASDGHNVKRIGKSRLSRSIGIALAACILVSSPAQAAKTPLISGTESDSDSEADGPALEDGTITENSADNTIASQSGSYTEEQLADSVIEYGELEALVRRGNGTAVSADYSYQGQPCRLP
ncbi:MAG: hypothetical protein ACLR8P_08250 [Clostridium fessum]